MKPPLATSRPTPARFTAQLMRILVTGASGFLGRAIVRRLGKRADMELFACSRLPLPGIACSWIDLLDTAFLQQAIADFAPDAVIHAAGRAHGPASRMLRDNAAVTGVDSGEALVAAAPSAGLVLLSSAAQSWSNPGSSAVAGGRSSPAGQRLRAFQTGGRAGGVLERRSLGPEGELAQGLQHRDRRPGQSPGLGAVRAVGRRSAGGAAASLGVDGAVGGDPRLRHRGGCVRRDPGSDRSRRLGRNDQRLQRRRADDPALWIPRAFWAGSRFPIALRTDAVSNDRGVAWSVGDPAKAERLLGLRPSGDLAAVLDEAVARIEAAGKAGADARPGA